MKMMPTVSQGVPANKAFFPISKAQKPQGTIAGTADGAVGAATGGGAQSMPTEIDLQAFFAAWGTDNAQFDATKDGTVDGQDLSLFLGSATQQLGKQATPDQVLGSWGQQNGGGDVNGDGTVDGFDLALTLGQATQAPKNSPLADGVQKAWGTNNKAYDLNGDGTVDGTDLAMALGQGSANGMVNGGTMDGTGTSNGNTDDDSVGQPATQAAAQAGEVAAKLTDAVLQAKDANGDGELTASELQSAAGYVADADKDGDSAISRDELQSRLTSVLSNASAKSTTDFNAVTTKWAQALLKSDNAAVHARNAYGTGTSALANQLYSKLAANGFSNMPPSNLAKLVQGLGINDAQRTSVMRGLANRYPNGLGISAQA